MAVEDSFGKKNRSVVLCTAGDKEFMASQSRFTYNVLQDECKVRGHSVHDIVISPADTECKDTKVSILSWKVLQNPVGLDNQHQSADTDLNRVPLLTLFEI